jgi:hypothetical protein
MTEEQIKQKAENLMIGDWVNLNFDIDYKTGKSIYAPVQITGINKDGTVDVNLTYDKSETMQDGWDLKLIIPIEISEEILRNNGFIKVNFLKYDEPRVGISLLYKERSDGEEGYRVLIENRKSGIETRTTIKPVKYVHEIQHTIKDLNIDREIIL